MAKPRLLKEGELVEMRGYDAAVAASVNTAPQTRGEDPRWVELSVFLPDLDNTRKIKIEVSSHDGFTGTELSTIAEHSGELIATVVIGDKAMTALFQLASANQRLDVALKLTRLAEQRWPSILELKAKRPTSDEDIHN